MPGLVLSCHAYSDHTNVPAEVLLADSVKIITFTPMGTSLNNDVAWDLLRTIEAPDFNPAAFVKQVLDPVTGWKGAAQTTGKFPNLTVSGGKFPSGVYLTNCGNTSLWQLKAGMLRSLYKQTSTFGTVYAETISGAKPDGDGNIFVFWLACLV